MTQTERQQRDFYRRTGISFLGISFERAMSIPALRIAITCGSAARNKTPQAPAQPSLI